MDNEKKVEYIELVYDLIFVYIVGRNNSLIHSVHEGFIKPEVYLTYFFCTLIVLQIWNLTTLYINRYGTNGIKEHVALFVNMYLLYYMAEGTRKDWQKFFFHYNIAWLLIILNLALQYYLKYREREKEKPWELEDIKWNIRQLLIMAVIIFISLPVNRLTGLTLSPLAMMAGITINLKNSGRIGVLVPVDFSHLTERVMLYVVFTFGEMVIVAASYFETGISFNTVYFSLMVFLIVIGLFVSYEYVYDHILDREGGGNSILYMVLHMFLILALNNITISLEFMREPAVDMVKKNIFLLISFLIYYFFLSLTNIYAKEEMKANRLIYIWLGLYGGLFTLLMAIFYRNSRISIAVTVLFVLAVFLLQIRCRRDCARRRD